MYFSCVGLYFNIIQECYFLDNNQYLMDEVDEAWKDLDDNGIISLKEKRCLGRVSCDSLEGFSGGNAGGGGAFGCIG